MAVPWLAKETALVFSSYLSPSVFVSLFVCLSVCISPFSFCVPASTCLLGQRLGEGHKDVMTRFAKFTKDSLLLISYLGLLITIYPWTYLGVLRIQPPNKSISTIKASTRIKIVTNAKQTTPHRLDSRICFLEPPLYFRTYLPN